MQFISKQSFFYFFLSLLFVCSCVQTKPKQPIKVATDKYYHQVKYQGETLSIIAGWYTGNTKNWEKIALANDIKAPYTIDLGQVIAIPKTMLTRYELLPQAMIEKKSYLPESTIKRASLKPVPKELDLESKLKQLELEKSLKNK